MATLPNSPAVSPFAIECKNVTRKFGDFTAVDNLSLQVKTGELFGFLGPNGAGKTTTIKMLTTLIPLTSGSAKVAGYDLLQEPAHVRSCIGVVPQQFALFEELTPLENLWYIGELFDMDRDLMARRSDELLKTVTLFDKRDVVCEGFSGGMKQRLSIAASLLHTPQILFMDEPTSGLDPQSRIALRELTARLNKMGITIIYTTHDMEEADKLCERIAIIDHGKLIALGTPKEIKAMGRHRYQIVVETDRMDEKLAEAARRKSGALTATFVGTTLSMTARTLPTGMVSDLTALFAREDVKVRSLTVNEPTLEDIFIEMTKKALRD